MKIWTNVQQKHYRYWYPPDLAIEKFGLNLKEKDDYLEWFYYKKEYDHYWWKYMYSEKMAKNRAKWLENFDYHFGFKPWPEKRKKYKNAVEARWAKAGMVDATIEKYDKLKEEQENRCAICDKPSSNNKLAWDHNHQTGKTRSLLCTPCNLAVGWFEKFKNQETAQKIEDYLIKHAENPNI